MANPLVDILRPLGARLMVSSAPALGKTALAKAAADALGYRYIYGIGGRSADMVDRMDLAGIPCPDWEHRLAELLPLRALHEILSCTEDAVLVIDEIGRADLPEQGAWCSLLDTLPPTMRVVAITNRTEDGAGVRCEPSTQLHSRLGERYTLPTPDWRETADGPVALCPWISSDPTVTSLTSLWLDWALDSDADPMITSYHRHTTFARLWARPARPRHDIAYPDFRAWGRVIEQRRQGVRALNRTAAVLGRQDAVDFCAWETLADKIVTWEQIAANPLTAPVPSERDADALHLTVAHLARAASSQIAPAVAKYLARLPVIFAAVLAHDLVHESKGESIDRKRMRAALGGQREWIAWWDSHKQIVAGAQ